jgi:hypothetical protein
LFVAAYNIAIIIIIMPPAAHPATIHNNILIISYLTGSDIVVAAPASRQLLNGGINDA